MNWRILQGDVRETLATLPDESVQTCVTSPPYWGLRDYGHEGQIGLESTPDAYVGSLVAVFAEVRRVLADDGTLWLNLGDSYSGSGKGGNPDEGKQATNKGSQSIGVLYGKTGETAREAALTNVSRRWTAEQGIAPKNLIGIPWRVAFALQADGWYLRSDIIWSKPNPMPESVTDRPTKAHEYIFLLSKSARYYYDADAIKEPYAPDSLARYAYPFGGPKNIQLTAEEADGPGTRTRPIGLREYKGQATKDYDGAGVQNPSDTKRRILESMEVGQGRNKRTVWTINAQPYPDAHFATYPEKLIEPCILAGCPEGGTVLDPFTGSGTTGAVAIRHQRNFIGIELNQAYVTLAERRIRAVAPLFSSGDVQGATSLTAATPDGQTQNLLNLE